MKKGLLTACLFFGAATASGTMIASEKTDFTHYVVRRTFETKDTLNHISHFVYPTNPKAAARYIWDGTAGLAAGTLVGYGFYYGASGLNGLRKLRQKQNEQGIRHSKRSETRPPSYLIRRS